MLVQIASTDVRSRAQSLPRTVYFVGFISDDRSLSTEKLHLIELKYGTIHNAVP